MRETGSTGGASCEGLTRALTRLVARFKKELRGDATGAVVGQVESEGFSFLLLRVPAAPLKGLTARQREVARLAGAGLSVKAIARELGLSEPTIAKHIRRIYKKLDVSSRAELARSTITFN